VFSYQKITGGAVTHYTRGWELKRPSFDNSSTTLNTVLCVRRRFSALRITFSFVRHPDRREVTTGIDVTGVSDVIDGSDVTGGNDVTSGSNFTDFSSSAADRLRDGWPVIIMSDNVEADCEMTRRAVEQCRQW